MFVRNLSLAGQNLPDSDIRLKAAVRIPTHTGGRIVQSLRHFQKQRDGLVAQIWKLGKNAVLVTKFPVLACQQTNRRGREVVSGSSSAVQPTDCHVDLQ